MADSAATEPVFERCAGGVLKECLAIATTRGGEYLDTWSLDHLVTALTETTLQRFGVRLTRAQLRLVLLAALVDVKNSRIVTGGPFKMDSFVDGINYLSCYAALREEYELDGQALNAVQSKLVEEA